MRQLILQNFSSSFTFTTINDFQTLLECIVDYLYKNDSNEQDNNPIKAIIYKIYKFISSLDVKQKQKPLFELFTLF